MLRQLRVLDADAGVALFAAAVAVEDREAHLHPGVQPERSPRKVPSRAVAVVGVSVARREVHIGIVPGQNGLQVQFGQRTVVLGHQQRGVRRKGFGQQVVPVERGVDPDHRVGDAEPLVEVLVGQQFVDADARGGHQFVLGHVFRTVGVEVDAGLQQVEAREVAHLDARFGDAQPLARKRDRIAEVLQAQRLLDVVVIFGREAGHEVLDGDARLQRAHLLHLLQAFVVGADAQSVEQRPVHRQPDVGRLVVDAGLGRGVPVARGDGAVVVQRARVPGREVDRGEHPGVSRRGVVVADALFVAHDAHVVILFKPDLQTFAQGQRSGRLPGRRRLLRSGGAADSQQQGR